MGRSVISAKDRAKRPSDFIHQPEPPAHSATMGEMPERQIEEVLWAFKERVNDLKKDGRFRYILLFKNHGEAAGATLAHPHCQLIALPVIPKRAKEQIDGAKLFYD